MGRELTFWQKLMVAGIWLVAALIVTIPGGVVTQVWEANRRIDDRVAASPLGKLCHRCGGPAVASACYDDGGVRYFCRDHPPSEWVRAGNSRDTYGTKGLNPWYCTFVLGAVYGVYTLRALAQPFSDHWLFKSGFQGAFIGGIAALLLWYFYWTR